MLDSLLRKIVFSIAGSVAVRKWFQTYGMKFGVARFVAAESLPETLHKVKELNDAGLLVTLDCLGESVSDSRQAEEAAATISGLFPQIARHGLRANVSVKLTQLGLLIDRDECMENMKRILNEAEAYNNFVRIDMEDSSVTNSTVELFRTLLAHYGPERVGLVLQSYLYRSGRDVEALGKDGANLRIVKGAYLEQSDVAYRAKNDVDDAYIRLACAHLECGGYTAVATHDPKIIACIRRFTEERHIPREQFEFQMLYGIGNRLQRELVRSGYRVRVYVPFGKHWYPYFTRRIAERPANLWFVVKHILHPR